MNTDIKSNVIEIGGGYGRFAEAAYQVFPDKINKYFLVDAVPSSLQAAV